MKMSIVFLIAVGLAAPAFGSWGGSNAGNWAAPAANIVLSQDGHNVLDTPEVASARAAHLAALAQAQASNGDSNDDGSYDSRWEAESNYESAAAPQQYNNQQWNAAPATKWQNANIALSADGRHVLDTPEVAQARAAHLAAHAAVQTKGYAAPAQSWNAAPAQSWNAAPAQSWNAAPAQSWNAAPAPAWKAAPAQSWNAAPAQSWNAAPAQSWNNGAPAPVAETAEVTQARAAHAAAHAAIQPTQYSAPSSWNGAPSWHSAPAQNKWANAQSQIALSRDGQNVLDTPEVAQAKAAHLAAHAAAAAGAAPAHHAW